MRCCLPEADAGCWVLGAGCWVLAAARPSCCVPCRRALVLPLPLLVLLETLPPSHARSPRASLRRCPSRRRRRPRPSHDALRRASATASERLLPLRRTPAPREPSATYLTSRTNTRACPPRPPRPRLITCLPPTRLKVAPSALQPAPADGASSRLAAGPSKRDRGRRPQPSNVKSSRRSTTHHNSHHPPRPDPPPRLDTAPPGIRSACTPAPTPSRSLRPLTDARPSLSALLRISPFLLSGRRPTLRATLPDIHLSPCGHTSSPNEYPGPPSGGRRTRSRYA